MKSASLTRALTLGSFILAAAACSFRHEKLAPPAEGGESGSISRPSFSMVRDQVLIPRCVECHAGYADYDPAFDARDMIRQRTLVASNMPKNRPPLSQAERDLLRAWLDAGAPRQAPAEASAPPAPPVIEPLPPTWENVQAKFFKPHCARCHDDGEADPDSFDAGRIENVRRHATAILDRVIVSQDMPEDRQAYARITAEEKSLLVNWMVAKMPGPAEPAADHR